MPEWFGVDQTGPKKATWERRYLHIVVLWWQRWSERNFNDISELKSLEVTKILNREVVTDKKMQKNTSTTDLVYITIDRVVVSLKLRLRQGNLDLGQKMNYLYLSGREKVQVLRLNFMVQYLRGHVKKLCLEHLL